MYESHHSGWDWLWMAMMMGFWIVLIVLAVFLAVYLVQNGKRRQHP